jgi:hypothetical protein
MRKIILLVLLVGMVSAYDNSTSTGAYRKLAAGDPIHAIHDANTAAWGHWWFLIIAAGPYLGMWLYQQNFKLAQIWLICILAAYGYLFQSFNYVFYLLSAFWIAATLFKAFSGWYSS